MIDPTAIETIDRGALPDSDDLAEPAHLEQVPEEVTDVVGEGVGALVDEELLVEEISIDGMCGVY